MCCLVNSNPTHPLTAHPDGAPPTPRPPAHPPTALSFPPQVPELNVQNGVLKALSFLFEYIGEMGKDYIYAGELAAGHTDWPPLGRSCQRACAIAFPPLTLLAPYTPAVSPLLEDALMDRDLVHRQTACSVVQHMSLGVAGLGCEDALMHLLNYVFPNIFEVSPHIVQVSTCPPLLHVLAWGVWGVSALLSGMLSNLGMCRGCLGWLPGQGAAVPLPICTSWGPPPAPAALTLPCLLNLCWPPPRLACSPRWARLTAAAWRWGLRSSSTTCCRRVGREGFAVCVHWPGCWGRTRQCKWGCSRSLCRAVGLGLVLDCSGGWRGSGTTWQHGACCHPARSHHASSASLNLPRSLQRTPHCRACSTRPARCGRCTGGCTTAPTSGRR